MRLQATDIQNGTYADKLKKKSKRRLFGFGAGAVLGIVASHFMGLPTWKMVLAGGGIGLLVSGVKK